MNHPLILRIIFILNIALLFSGLYIFLLLTGKYYLTIKDFKKSEALFSTLGNSTGKLISLIENGKMDRAEKHAQTTSTENLDPAGGTFFTQTDSLAGILSLAKGNYTEALSHFEKTGNPRNLAYTYLKLSEISKAKKFAKKIYDPTLTHYLDLKEKNYAHYPKAVTHFFKSGNSIALANLFLQLDNIPTTVFNLISSGYPWATMIAQLLQNEELTQLPLEKIPAGDLKFWIPLLRGDLAFTGRFDPAGRTPFTGRFDPAGRTPLENLEQHLALPLLYYLNNNLRDFFKTEIPNADSFLQSINPTQSDPAASNKATLLSQFMEANPKLPVYSVLPEKIEVQDREGGFSPHIWAIGLITLTLIFFISLLSLYHKYSLTLLIQRQKDLEGMDALSILKSKDIEAKKKRDKTELNVSSFVTMNIQLEVLDAAFAKLGLRVDPKKLSEQIEQTKIPNISFKIYTISNAYGLGVKMLSIEASELPKQKAHGAVILILKGSLIALLKNADLQNVYLQFSQKDSRKVPYNVLKFSWDGNIIQLNRV
jgi:hypothetical protein